MGNNQVEPTRLNPQFSDRKLNLVIYGITDSPSDTKWCDRVKYDMDTSVTILPKINDSINSTSIRDCFRLGKYKQNQSRPRPILLKLNRAMDVATILSNRSSIDDNSIIIKPDMTPQNQHKETLLLKEQWALIKSGIDKVDIKIMSSSLYVKGTKHGYVLNTVFNRTSAILTMDTSSTNQNTLADSNTPNLQSNFKTTPQAKSQD